MLTELLLQFCSINKKSLFIQDRDRIKMDFHPGYKLYRRKNALTQSAASRLPNHFIAGPSASSQLLDQPDGYLCDSIFLQTQKDICIFQGEDTLLRSYIWDNSWLHSHRNTKVFHITGYSLVQTLSLYISISNFRHFNATSNSKSHNQDVFPSKVELCSAYIIYCIKLMEVTWQYTLRGDRAYKVHSSDTFNPKIYVL